MSNVENQTETDANMDHITMHIGKKMANSKRNTLVDMIQEKKRGRKMIWRLFLSLATLKLKNRQKLDT
jgi:tryptophanyl-tRNA synthetase